MYLHVYAHVSSLRSLKEKNKREETWQILRPWSSSPVAALHEPGLGDSESLLLMSGLFFQVLQQLFTPALVWSWSWSWTPAETSSQGAADSQ